MSKDMILVEREYDGERCDTACHYRNAEYGRCAIFDQHVRYTPGVAPGRCPTCLATPSAVVLTPEMVEAVNNLESWYSRHPKGGLLGHAKAWAIIRSAFPTTSPPEATNG